MADKLKNEKLTIISIVAIVAIVGIIALSMSGSRAAPSSYSFESSDSENLAGMAYYPPANTQIVWSSWLDRDGPGGSGDYETFRDFSVAQKGCANPVVADCMTTTGVHWNSTDDARMYCSPTKGLACLNKYQTNTPDRYCEDYKIRFGCEINVTPSPEYYCTDSDGGNDPYEMGYVISGDHNIYGSLIAVNDSCFSNMTLMEFTCENTSFGPTSKSNEVFCDSGCVNGACLPFDNSGCVDSDGGVNFMRAGNVSYNGSVYYDYCINSTSVVEYSCQGPGHTFLVEVINGSLPTWPCLNGAIYHSSALANKTFNEPRTLNGQNGILKLASSPSDYARGYCQIVQGCEDLVTYSDSMNNMNSCRCSSGWGCTDESCTASYGWNRYTSITCSGCPA